MKVRANINNGTIFEVINIKIFLYLLELNKYSIPTKVFNVKIDGNLKGIVRCFCGKNTKYAYQN